jgi:MFS family permease
VPFSVIGLLASRVAVRAVDSLGANNVLVVGSLLTAAVGAFFGFEHSALWQAFVATGILGLAFGFSFAAIPGLVTRAIPARETGSALGLYQVIRAVGFSIGSALTASILAANIASPSVLPTRHGYVLALWVGSAVAMAAAVVTLVIGRGAVVPVCTAPAGSSA